MTVIDLVRQAFQDLLTEFFAGSSPLSFVDAKDRAAKHAYVHEHLEAWKKSRNCIVFGCGSQAIQRSHTIQRAGPLKQIAEEGLVMTPRLRADQYGLSMRKVPIVSASIFPGFCIQHEQLFRDFEQRRALRHTKDFVLQAYRATCREAVRLEIERAYFMQNADAFSKAHDDFMVGELSRRISAKGETISPDLIRQTITRSEPSGLPRYHLLMQATWHDLQKLRGEHIRAIEQALFTQSTTNLPVSVVTLPIEIPVCLSGMDCINLSIGDRDHRVLVILNVIPEPGNTHIIGYVPPGDQEFLAPYMEAIDGLLPGLNTIESAMLHSTDHWYLRPSVWNRLPEKRRNQILSEVELRDGNAFQSSMHSIFDEVRIELLDRLEASNPEDVSTDVKISVLAFERKKLVGIENAEEYWIRR
jgi:hypothetical protein